MTKTLSFCPSSYSDFSKKYYINFFSWVCSTLAPNSMNSTFFNPWKLDQISINLSKSHGNCCKHIFGIFVKWIESIQSSCSNKGSTDIHITIKIFGFGQKSKCGVFMIPNNPKSIINKKNTYLVGVKIRNLKVDFKTGGTWRRVGQ